MLLSALLSGVMVGRVWADPAATRTSLDRLEEVLTIRLEEGMLRRDEVLPALLVSVQPRDPATASWLVTGAVSALERSLGRGSIRLCEACMVPRMVIEDGRMIYQSGPLGLDEVARLDEQGRGETQPARTAIWVDEHHYGVSVRIVDIQTGRVLFAQNLDPDLIEVANTERVYTMSEELERRARGDSLTQVFTDFALYPGQHISIDWTDQWGPANENLSGLTLSVLDPVAGLGVCHYRTLPVLDILVGGQFLVSVPTAVVQSLDQGGGSDVIDPLATLVGVARIPFGRSNYAGVATISTNGQVGLGVSLLNISLLPVIP